jgi:hypothetical protein
MQLQRRTKPAGEEAPAAASSGKANPFGAARPVDTAKKLAEVEAKIEQPTFSVRKPVR